jgi:histidine triad (HIT) family protein
MSGGDTIFDKILRKEIPSTVVFEDEDILAFRDISAQAPTHVLVIPKKKLTGFNQLTEISNEQAGLLFRGAAKVAKELGLADSGYRIVVNSGKHGQQTVDYIHVHILGGKQLKWPPG